MQPLVWTAAKPTAPGWYWWRLKPSDPSELWEIVHVCKDVWMVTDDEGFQMKLCKYDGQFAGPIALPVEVRQ